MIAPVRQSFTPSEPQKQVKKMLEKMTGLGVKIVPFTAPIGGGIPTVNYEFKCALPEGSIPTQADASNAFYDYLQTLLMKHAGATYNVISLARSSGDDDKDGLFPYVVLRFSDITGHPSGDLGSVDAAKAIERKHNEYVKANVNPPLIEHYHELHGKGTAFKDAYANQIKM